MAMHRFYTTVTGYVLSAVLLGGRYAELYIRKNWESEDINITKKILHYSPFTATQTALAFFVYLDKQGHDWSQYIAD